MPEHAAAPTPQTQDTAGPPATPAARRTGLLVTFVLGGLTATPDRKSVV